MTEDAEGAPTASAIAHDPNAASGPLFEFNRPTVIVLFYLATYFTGFSALVGVILAYVWRDEAEGWEESHMTWLIRTFWLALGIVFLLAIGVIALLVASSGLRQPATGQTTAAVVALIVLVPLAGVWLLLRCIRSLINAQRRKAMERPRTLLI